MRKHDESDGSRLFVQQGFNCSRVDEGVKEKWLVTVKRERRSSVDADGCGTRTEGTFIRPINGVVLVGAAAIYDRRNVLSFSLADNVFEKQQGARCLMRRTLFYCMPR